MGDRNPRRARWGLAFCLTLLIVFGISVLAYLGVVKAFWNTESHLDLWMHGILTGLLALFLNGVLDGKALRVLRGVSVNLAAAIVLAGAGLDELAQTFSVHRTVSVADYLADIAGVVLFLGGAEALRRLRQ